MKKIRCTVILENCFAIAEDKLEIIRKGNQFEDDLENGEGDQIDGLDFNQKFEDALIIGQSYGLDPVKMRNFYTLLKTNFAFGFFLTKIH